MIIYFNSNSRKFWVEASEAQTKISLLLIALREKTEYDQFSLEFYDYIRETYKIDVNFTPTGIIESIEMPDDVYTMLLLMNERH